MVEWSFVTNLFVPFLKGLFVVIFLIIFLGVVYFGIWKGLGVNRLLTRLFLRMQRKKLLQDDAILRYCVKRQEMGWKEDDVRKELLMANKYPNARINQIAYVFNIINKEMGVNTKYDTAKDLPE